MNLPAIPLPRDVVNVAGVEVKVRGLSRSEVLRLSKFQGDADAAENFMLTCGLDCDEGQVRVWRESIPATAGDELVERIAELSGLIEGAQKSG